MDRVTWLEYNLALVEMDEYGIFQVEKPPKNFNVLVTVLSLSRCINKNTLRLCQLTMTYENASRSEAASYIRLLYEQSTELSTLDEFKRLLEFVL